jgi:hypothetical protein
VRPRPGPFQEHVVPVPHLHQRRGRGAWPPGRLHQQPHLCRVRGQRHGALVRACVLRVRCVFRVLWVYCICVSLCVLCVWLAPLQLACVPCTMLCPVVLLLRLVRGTASPMLFNPPMLCHRTHLGKPVIQDLSCSPNDTVAYCVGQPAAVVRVCVLPGPSPPRPPPPTRRCTYRRPPQRQRSQPLSMAASHAHAPARASHVWHVPAAPHAAAARELASPPCRRCTRARPAQVRSHRLQHIVCRTAQRAAARNVSSHRTQLLRARDPGSHGWFCDRWRLRILSVRCAPTARPLLCTTPSSAAASRAPIPGTCSRRSARMELTLPPWCVQRVFGVGCIRVWVCVSVGLSAIARACLPVCV